MLEDEYIDNLQQQIHYMELELKLLKQKQEEEEKSGGAAGLFLDEQTSSQHLILLKEKHKKMSNELRKQVTELNKQKAELQTAGGILKLEQEMKQKKVQESNEEAKEKAIQMERELSKLESEYNKKLSERNILQDELRKIIDNFEMQQKTNLLLRGQEENDKAGNTNTLENAKRRINQQVKLIEKLKADELKLNEEIVKHTYIFILQQSRQEKTEKNAELASLKQKNEKYAASIEEREKALTKANIIVKELEAIRELHNRLKEDEINERRLLVQKNDELKKAISDKDVQNNIKINKKLQDKIGGDLKALQVKSEDNNEKLKEVKDKIIEEQGKISSLTKEIIELRNSCEIYDKQKNHLIEITDANHLKIEEMRAKGQENENLLRENIEKVNISN